MREGRFGPYVNWGKVNANIPKSIPIDMITLNDAIELIAEREGKPARPAKAPPKAAGEKDAGREGRGEEGSGQEGGCEESARQEGRAREGAKEGLRAAKGPLAAASPVLALRRRKATPKRSVSDVRLRHPSWLRNTSRRPTRSDFSRRRRVASWIASASPRDDGQPFHQT